MQKESSEFGSVQRSDPPSLPPRDSHDQLELDDLEMYNTENLEELELKLQEEDEERAGRRRTDEGHRRDDSEGPKGTAK